MIARRVIWCDAVVVSHSHGDRRCSVSTGPLLPPRLDSQSLPRGMPCTSALRHPLSSSPVRIDCLLGYFTIVKLSDRGVERKPAEVAVIVRV
jgi:hypothetical protein